MAITTFTAGTKAKASEVNANFEYLNYNGIERLGDVIMVAPTLSGATSLASRITDGWAVCDGTTPSSQGITGATIATTPNLVASFIRGNASTSGASGGDSTHNHGGSTTVTSGTTTVATSSSSSNTGFDNYSGSGNKVRPQHINSDSHIPPYYELVFMIKVKIV